ncbi:GNAT family N-acetyltransferase [Paenibacillus sp. BR2-3]|uniref:GNAT family N-acetyltransferase n=1 Tax=Paenibacillus sp. BR2-3 TaxID=3048494 RepID=UPI003977C775
MRLEGQRVYLVPLSAAELLLAVENYGELQCRLGLKDTAAALDEEMQYAMTVRRRKVLQDQENFLWLTNWAIVHSEERCIIGFVILKGPKEKGEVIAGYVIDEDYRRQGYATEALQVITEWILSDPRVLYVVADTEKDNVASHKVLEHLGAQRFQETDDLVWWRIAKSGISS